MPPAKSAIWNRAEEIVHLLKEGWTLDRLAKHLRTIIYFIGSIIGHLLPLLMIGGRVWSCGVPFIVVQPVAVARPRKKQRGPYAAAPYGDAECFCNRRGLGALRFCDRPLKPCHRIYPSWGDNCARNLLRHSVRILRLPLPILREGEGKAVGRRWGLSRASLSSAGQHRPASLALFQSRVIRKIPQSSRPTVDPLEGLEGSPSVRI